MSELSMSSPTKHTPTDLQPKKAKGWGSLTNDMYLATIGKLEKAICRAKLLKQKTDVNMSQETQHAKNNKLLDKVIKNEK